MHAFPVSKSRSLSPRRWSSYRQSQATTAVTVVLWLLVFAGAIAGVWSATRSTTAAEARPVASTIPASVSAAERFARLYVANRPSAPLAPGPIADTVSGFLVAYVTGAGDVARYVRPGSGIDKPVPVFTTMTIPAASITEQGDTAVVGVEVSGTDDTRRSTTTAYVLSLVRRGERWEVAEVLAAPPLLELERLNRRPR